MIKVAPAKDQNSLFTLNASVGGLTVYLDNFAIKDLAKGDRSRRDRFITLIHSGVELLFSVANAAELTGPTQGSFRAIRTFLDALGAHWFPVELNAYEVVQREMRGVLGYNSCLCERFLKDFVGSRLLNAMRDGKPDWKWILNASDEIFQLGLMMEWLAPQRDSIRRGLTSMDEALVTRINSHVAKFKSDPQWLDKEFPSLTFDPALPGIFTYFNLVRTLVLESKQYRFKKGDGIDFCHAFMSSAFASVGTLDKHWKRRIETLPKPNGLATIYYAEELDSMIVELETALRTASVKGPMPHSP